MTNPASSTPPKLLFLVTEDWFFCSHFLPMARAALADGFDVAVACRERAHGDQIRGLGCRLLPLEADRKSLNPFAMLSTLLAMHRLIRLERPDIVHLIALRSIIIGGLAAVLAGVSRRVIALTGMGLLGATQTANSRMIRSVLRWYIRSIVDGKDAHFLFENRSDPMLLRLEPDDRRKVTIVGGAGVDPEVFIPVAMPSQPPLKLAMVARMLWSKGVDTAVDAVRQARNAGCDATLSLYGAPDPDNPKAIPETTLHAWSAEPGIHWLGSIKQSEVPALWASHHLAVFPSRGGEGLPRTLLEAAACGRPILTSNVPGCRDLVRDGVEGFVVEPDDSSALARLIIMLAGQPDQLTTMAAAARNRVLDGHTEAVVGRSVLDIYRTMMRR